MLLDVPNALFPIKVSAAEPTLPIIVNVWGKMRENTVHDETIVPERLQCRCKRVVVAGKRCCSKDGFCR